MSKRSRAIGALLSTLVASALAGLAFAAHAGFSGAPMLLALAGLGLAGACGMALLLQHANQALIALQAGNDAEARRIQEVFDALQIGLVLYDRDDRIVLTNKDFRALYRGLEEHLQPGVPFERLLRQVVQRGQMADLQGDVETWIRQRLEDHRHARRLILRRMPDGHWRRITEQRLADGSLLAHSVDVTELLQREEQLKRLNADLDAMNGELARLSETDALTGLANRRQFDRVLVVEWSRARRHGTPLSLLILDVDHFKRFNDRHGHPMGDVCLREIAKVLRGSASRPADLVARVGGEEFAILLPHVESLEAAQLASRCIEAVAQAAIAHGDSPVDPFVTVSVGVADADSAGTTAEPLSLVEAADAALYRAKREGRFRFAVAAAQAGGIDQGTTGSQV